MLVKGATCGSYTQCRNRSTLIHLCLYCSFALSHRYRGSFILYELLPFGAIVLGFMHLHLQCSLWRGGKHDFQIFFSTEETFGLKGTAFRWQIPTWFLLEPSIMHFVQYAWAWFIVWSNNITLLAHILNNGQVHRIRCHSIPNCKPQLYCAWKSIDINALLLGLRHQKFVYGHMICMQAHLCMRRVAYTCIYVHARLSTMIDGWIVISIILIFDVILIIFMIT